jgi:hypothetical protein
MAAPSLTYSLTNGTTADASQVQQNFNDIINGISDGTKDLSLSALTLAGTLTANGHVNLGNSSADDLTITASLASDLVPKTTGTYSVGSASLGFLGLYLAASADADTARIIAASHTADRDYTIPDAGANAEFVMTAGTQTIGGSKTFSNAITASGGISVTGAINATSGDATIGTTPVTIYTMANVNPSCYLVFITRSSEGNSCDVFVVFKGSSVTAATSLGGAGAYTLSFSGLNIQATRGSSIASSYAILRIF